MRFSPWLLLIVPGIFGVLFFGYYTMVDFAALQRNYHRFEVQIPHANLKTLFVLEARQNIHRINVFADGVWTLMCGLLLGLGIHGWLLERALITHRKEVTLSSRS